MGRLIPAGTGLPSSRRLGIQIEGAEEEYQDVIEPDLGGAETGASAAEEAGIMVAPSEPGSGDTGLDV